MISIAWYNKKDWLRLLEIIDDKESMPETWEEWHSSYLKVKMELISHGISVNDFVVDIDDLISYCVRLGIKNDGKARSQFVSRP